MGNLGILGNNENKNFIHIIFNNAAHESVGGQPTIYNSLDSKNLFKSLGYKEVLTVNKLEELEDINVDKFDKPALIEIRVQNSSDKDLMRPDKTPIENKNNFIDKINE